MKVSSLKEGMLLRFKKPRSYDLLHDNMDLQWIYFNTTWLPLLPKTRPLMIYMGQKKLASPSYYGKWRNVRRVLIEGQVACIWPDMWKHIEVVPDPILNESHEGYNKEVSESETTDEL